MRRWLCYRIVLTALLEGTWTVAFPHQQQGARRRSISRTIVVDTITQTATISPLLLLYSHDDPLQGSKEDSSIDQLREIDYEKRRHIWANRYGSVEALRENFGAAPPWGDLDSDQSRQLYHTLLPRSLLALNEAGLMRPDELAPLAYQARVAAKDYTRERCTLPGRMLAVGFDAYRSFRRDGTFQTKGLSWEQLWDKYEAQIVEEECVEELKGAIDEEALTTRIYLRILERSCATNKAFDQMFLQNATEHSDELADLAAIANMLESDVRDILLQPKKAKKLDKFERKSDKKQGKMERKAERSESKLQKEIEKASMEDEKRRQKIIRKRIKLRRKIAKKRPFVSTDVGNKSNAVRQRDRRSRAYCVLRVIVGTRRRFRKLRSHE